MKIEKSLFDQARASVLAVGAATVILLPAATSAQTNVWHDDFDQFPIGANSDDGSYGAVAYNFSGTGYGHPFVMITNDLPDTLPGIPGYTHTNNCAFIFDANPADFSGALNFGLRINRIPVIGGNTNTTLRSYTLNFDIAANGASFSDIGGYVAPGIGIYGNGSGEYYGDGCESNVPVAFFPPAGSGYQHVSVNLASFGTSHASLLNPTDGTFSFYINGYFAGHSYPGNIEIDLANVSITMSNPPPPPPPTMTVTPAKPGLRVFAQDHTFTYNQEGFGTVDANQSWVGVATPANPVSYAITFADFDTVNNYTLYVQFVQNASGGDPYGVYNGQNALVWSITHQASGFTTAINWKTNAPQGNENNNAISLTTASLNGRGTWILTFTNDTDGTIFAPDGTTGSFSLDPTVAADFANPLVIDFGTAPNNTAGYGQWITYGKIAITNVVDGNEYDDFTKDDVFNTSLWNPGFSYNPASATDAGSVFQVSSNTPSYWLNWTTPDDGYGLATKASLRGGTNVWFTPNYYGSGVGVTNTLPQLMGTALKWTLVPNACLPTVDGTVGGTPSKTGYFRLSNPAPTQ
jgi:hypothetical protein